MQKKNLVVLTGAGISAESGLKTFRDSDGLWEGYNINEVATSEGFQKNPQLVLDFYNMRRSDVSKAQPNNAHYGLTNLEDFFDVTIITQNIDDLHERSGSKNVMHLHGEIFKMRSVKNYSKIYSIYNDIKVGDTAYDGGQLRPHIVWFGEEVPMIEPAINVVSKADLFVVIGTSLQVYPAASLVEYTSPKCINYVIDKSIPLIKKSYNFIVIEDTAVNGVKQLVQLLSL